MSLREHGFALVGLDPVPGAVVAAFAEPSYVNAYGYGVVRLRMSWTADDDWLFLPVPSYEVPYDVPYDGADRRLEAGMAALLRRALGGPWLDVHADWLIELHRVRTVAPAGTTVPVRLPGPPDTGDGGFGMVAVVGRAGVGAGRVRLFGAGRSAPLLDSALGPGQGLLFDRRTVAYERHELAAGPAGPVVEDLLVAHVSRPAGPEPALRRRPMLVRGPAGTLLRTRPALR